MDGRLNLKVLVKDPPKGWPFLHGDLTKDLILNELPFMEKVSPPKNDEVVADTSQDGEEKESSEIEEVAPVPGKYNF